MKTLDAKWLKYDGAHFTRSSSGELQLANPGGGGSGTPYRYLNIAGRINAGSGDTWNGPHSTGGAGFGTWSDNLGGGAEPTLSSTSQGPLLFEDEIVKRIYLTYKSNNAQVLDIQARFDAHYFDTWNGTDDTPASQSIASMSTTSFNGTHQTQSIIFVTETIEQDSMFVPKFQVTVGGTTTRYVMFDMIAVIETVDLFA